MRQSSKVHEEIFFNLSAFVLGEGTKIKFWKDKWCVAETLAEKFPNLFYLALNKEAYVAECWCTATHSWNLGLRRNMLDNEIANAASALEILHSWAPIARNDSLNWIPNMNGNFTTKSTFLNLTKRSPNIAVTLIRHIWKNKIPKKVKFFLWSLAYRSLNTHEKLQRKIQNTLISPSMCCLCAKDEETLDHLFLHCPFTKKAWNTLFGIFDLELCLPSKIDSWMIEGLNIRGYSPKGNI